MIKQSIIQAIKQSACKKAVKNECNKTERMGAIKQ